MLTYKPLILLCMLTILTVVNSSCYKRKNRDPNSDNGLPPPTTTGKGTFACRVNGVPWISRKGSPKMDAVLVPTGDSIGIGGSISDNGIEEFTIVLFGVYDSLLVDYELTDTTTAYVDYSKSRAGNCFITEPGYGSYADRKIPNGSVHFTRTTGGIVSGTFSFYVPRDFCDTLFITDGRFDIKYRIYP